MNINDGYIELQKRIGYDFRDSDILIRALSHSSYINELKLNKHDDYERTEFLGDAVLELTVSEFLYNEHPEMREGEMTKLRASLSLRASPEVPTAGASPCHQRAPRGYGHHLLSDDK